MLVEALESRRLMCTSPVAAASELATPAISLKAAKANTVLPMVQAYLASSAPKPIGVSMHVSGGQVLRTAADCSFSGGEELTQTRRLGAAATTSAGTYSITIHSGTFSTSSLSPFPATYTFNLNAKNPLKLFTIKQTSGGNHLTFTGVLNKSVTVLSGVITITGPNRSLHLTYQTT